MNPAPGDAVVDTPDLAVLHCPACEPDRDCSREILDVRWCWRHQPRYEGRDDATTVLGGSVLSAIGGAEGETNRRWCELLHRGSSRK